MTAEARSAAPARGLRLRSLVAALVLLLMLPPLALASFALLNYVGAERARITERALALAHAKADAVEAELGTLAALATALSNSPLLLWGELVSFRAGLDRFVAEQGLLAIRVTDADGRRLLDTAEPGLMPPQGRGQQDVAVPPRIAGPTLVVLDLPAGPGGGRPVLRMTVQALAPAAEQAWLLELLFEPDRISGALRRGDLAQGWVVSAVDPAGRVVGRNARAEEFVGRTATADLLANTSGRSGTWFGHSLDGRAVLAAFARTGTGDWRVVVGVPLSVLEAPLRQSLFWLLGIGGSVAGLALLASLLLAQRVEAAGRKLVAAAAALGGGERIGRVETGILEANVVALAMAEAAERLRERAAATRAAVAEAEQERELLQSVVDGVADGVFVTDTAGRFVLVNEAAARDAGLPEAEILGRGIRDLLPPAAAQRLEASEADLLRVAPGSTVEDEILLPGNEAGPRITVVRRTAWWSPEGKVLGLIGVSHDVTAQRRAERRLRDLESQFQRAARRSTVGAMASGLAHELNQPLAAAAMNLGGTARLLASAAADPALPEAEAARLAQARGAVERASAQLIRAGDIVRRLRDFVGRGETERKDEALAPAVREAASLALGVAGGEGVALEVLPDPDPPLVASMDRLQIQQVVVNLVRNAAEATRGCPRREVTVAFARRPPAGAAGPMAEVSVADTGSGIAPEVAAHLFESFVSTKEDGMGIGLSICRSIVEAHGGQLTAGPNPDGAGTVFRFTLPLATGEAVTHV
jgi:PAS domain S-box-containing protein